MKKGFIFILLLLPFIDCNAQIILNKPVDITIGDINFNPDVISKNKIKKIDIIISDKPDGSIILNKGAGIIYRFNEKGYVTRYIYSVLNKKEVEEIETPAIKKRGKIIKPETYKTVIRYVNDTQYVYVFYDIKNQVIAKRYRLGTYFHTYYYEYNELGQMRKEYHSKEINISDDPKEFKLGEQKIISSDVFDYLKLTNTQTKKRTLNDQLNVYKKTIINYDDKKNILSENSEFIVSCMRQESTYEYDNNRLMKRIYFSNGNGEMQLKSIFEYEKNGNLKSEKKYKNDVLIFESQFIYDETATFIKSEVDRDYMNATVLIKKYEYTFYE